MKSFIERVITQPLKEFFQKLVDFLPAFLSALLVFVLGLVLAWVVKAVVVRLFKLLKLDGLFARTGLSETLRKMAVKDTPAKFAGRLCYWLVVVTFFIISLSMLKLPAVEQLFERFLLFLPNLFVAAVILTIGFLVGNFLGRAVLIASVNAGVKLSGLLSKAVKTLVLLFALVMALEQLGIARSTVLVAFAIVFGGAVLALSLAFGLGGREIARDYLEKRFKKDGGDEPDEIKHI
jgi:small-conductance mechanosensitive channel